ncbi:hypothetical protein GUJ93_ZPchr0013g35944 [Zizania palustris]|uniref:Uncharacterized protein n=1 Tax=Zizania palustris TaxID=103762 RepID=A0A8J5X0U0_ZIZPA|nr:hypothetical protein GUJ93_ZPchr0013g35944 [Zizania palustris]
MDASRLFHRTTRGGYSGLETTGARIHLGAAVASGRRLRRRRVARSDVIGASSSSDGSGWLYRDKVNDEVASSGDVKARSATGRRSGFRRWRQTTLGSPAGATTAASSEGGFRRRRLQTAAATDSSGTVGVATTMTSEGGFKRRRAARFHSKPME